MNEPNPPEPGYPALAEDLLGRAPLTHSVDAGAPSATSPEGMTHA